MEKPKAFLRSQVFLIIVMFLIVSGLSYLIFVPRFGYFNDDWYLMYSAGAKGASVFRDIFSIDRPGRVLVMMPAYWLFGQNPLYYNLSAYFFRLLSGIGFFWLLDMLWPRRRMVTASMALLFLIYPGFLSQPNAIDYQSHIVALAAAMLSIGCTVKAILSERLSSKAIFFSLSILLGWFYLWQMEWYIGFEVLRWAGVFMLVFREGNRTLLQKVWRTIRRAYPMLVVPVLFLLWRILLFKPERGATDVGLQLDQVIQSPLTTALRRFTTLLSDSLDVVILAWGQPLSSLLSWIWSRDQLLFGLGLSALSVVAALFVLKQLEGPEGSAEADWCTEGFWLGTVGVLGGLLPIILVNRYVEFDFYSRYTLVSSAGAVILLVSLLFSLQNAFFRKAVFSGLILVASLTHFANSQKAVQITASTRNFWWQVYWRAPGLSPHTTLIANYAVGATEEDYFVWGPANLIYFPEGTKERYVQPGVYAAVLNRDTVIKVLSGEGQEFDNRRTIRTYKNYRNVLVLTQSTASSCVHVLNGGKPEYSRNENASIQIVGPYSNLEDVLTDLPAPVPASLVFGPEPVHDWCFYYQKADLARQRGDWAEIVLLGEEASNKGFAPLDLIEWIPFLQAYAITGEIDRLIEFGPALSSDPYLAGQACLYLGGIEGLSGPVLDAVNSLFCNG